MCGWGHRRIIGQVLRKSPEEVGRAVDLFDWTRNHGALIYAGSLNQPGRSAMPVTVRVFGFPFEDAAAPECVVTPNRRVRT